MYMCYNFHLKQPRLGLHLLAKYRVQQLCIWSGLTSKVLKSRRCRAGWRAFWDSAFPPFWFFVERMQPLVHVDRWPCPLPYPVALTVLNTVINLQLMYMYCDIDPHFSLLLLLLSTLYPSPFFVSSFLPFLNPSSLPLLPSPSCLSFIPLFSTATSCISFQY